MRNAALAFIMLSTSALAEVPRVITDIPPVQALVAAVMDGVGTPVVLLGQGASPHHYTMRPSQARDLAQADLVVWMGPQLTGWLERPLAALSDSEQMLLLDLVGTVRLPFRKDVVFEDHDHAHEGHGHDESGEGIDPHAWLDPVNGVIWASAITDRLSEMDPENAPVYLANWKKLVDDLTAFEADSADRLAPAHEVPFIVLHDAYHYFESRFGLNASGSVSDGHATTPGPQRIAALRATVENKNVRCAFAEPQEDTGLLDTIAEGTDLQIINLDPLGDGSDYPALLREMADAFSGCLIK